MIFLPKSLNLTLRTIKLKVNLVPSRVGKKTTYHLPRMQLFSLYHMSNNKKSKIETYYNNYSVRITGRTLNFRRKYK